ncbi:zinc-binding protein A33-like [Centroberyx gerrardi]|uniref:zinc-binding protein A33-like n=1 Tax=Centroberyx gerrardi TaxID=166262 RepID=UPI003AAF2C34
MAARSSLSEEDLLCPVCCEVFSLPVLLKCGHNSCKACLQKQWEWKGSRECPVCRTLSVAERPPINLALKIAADSFQEQRTCEDQELCILHNEKLKIFCQNDEEPICLVCQTSKQHKIHEFCPVGEAALEKKIEVSAKLESLQKQLKTLNKTKGQWEETKNYLKTQAHQNEKVIKEEFEKLHQFLWEEERARLVKLRHEEEMKSQVMCVKLEYIEDKIKNLSSIISDIETAIRASDVPFLQDYKKTKKRAKYNIQDPECIRDILIDSARHLRLLKFEIWKKMVEVVKCVPITLDPNTAQPNLRLSEELTCAQYGSKQLLPDNPERCNSRISVLGATGFTSGKHSWTVDVGHGKDWYIGVARESIKRKTTIFLNPTEGFWVIGLCNGETYWAQTSPRTRLSVKKKPQKITVELDYDKGKVVFLNTADLTPIHTFKDRFTERIFPYFAPGMYEEGKSSSPLTICPMTIAIDVQ